MSQNKRVFLLTKRIFDIFVSLVILILFLPLFFIVGLLILFVDGYPIFFKQKRLGKNNKEFFIYKFRTMSSISDDNSDKERITKLGGLLRNSSIDELPELLNVIKGNMSLVGPRPLLPEYLSLYSKRQLMRHEVMPGITGLAQINGRNNIEWEEKLELDCKYVENTSFLLDIKILLKTVVIVLKRKNISKDGYATTPKFKGNNND